MDCPGKGKYASRTLDKHEGLVDTTGSVTEVVYLEGGVEDEGNWTRGKVVERGS